MTIPSHQECMKPILSFLSDKKEHTVKEIDEHIAHVFHLTDEEKQQKLPSGGAFLYKSRSNWARVYLSKAGLILKPKKAVFKISDEGIKLNADTSVTEIDNDVLMRYDSFKDFREISKVHKKDKTAHPNIALDTSQEDTPEITFEQSFNQINSALADDLIAEMTNIDNYQFEQLVLDLLKAVGYGVDGEVRVTQKSRDNGIDGIISEDKLGFSKIYVQIKKYAEDNKVSRPELQTFVGAIAGLDGKGLFVTLSDFTEGAKEYAKSQNLVLINGQTLAKLMIEHNFGVSIKKTYEIKTIDSDLFADYTN